MSEFTRRSFIGKTAVALGSFVALQKVVGAARSKSDPGPANPMLDGQNPDSMWPPPTDSKSLVQNFKYPFSFANKRTYQSGWSREVTVRELPVSKTLAGVNMRLTAGGIPRAALAHGRRMGHHVIRKCADYRDRPGWQKFRRRRGQK
jgi:oxalate decarboxylase